MQPNLRPKLSYLCHIYKSELVLGAEEGIAKSKSNQVDWRVESGCEDLHLVAVVTTLLQWLSIRSIIFIHRINKDVILNIKHQNISQQGEAHVVLRKTPQMQRRGLFWGQSQGSARGGRSPVAWVQFMSRNYIVFFQTVWMFEFSWYILACLRASARWAATYKVGS